MTTLAAPAKHTVIPDLGQRIDAICRLVPPAWPLRDIVAVNPYLGCVGHDPLTVESLLQRRWGAAAIPAWSHLAVAWRTGEFSQEDLLAVLASPQRPAGVSNIAEVVRMLESPTRPTLEQERCLTTAAQLQTGRWQELIIAQIGRFLAGRYDQGIARWAVPAPGDLYADVGGHGSHAGVCRAARCPDLVRGFAGDGRRRDGRNPRAVRPRSGRTG
jgi:uncharacterized protein